MIEKALILRLTGEAAAIAFSLVPDASERLALARVLKVSAIKKLRFEGEVSPDGTEDWLLTGKLGATVVQPCIVTLAPVTTRIDVPVERTYTANFPDVGDASETEMPDDENIEPLRETIDVSAVMAEALALEIPDFPRAKGVETVEVSVTEPGKTPMTDDDAKPFAGLADFKKTLEENGGNEG